MGVLVIQRGAGVDGVRLAAAAGGSCRRWYRSTAGYWHARAPELLHSPLMGDTGLAAGAGRYPVRPRGDTTSGFSPAARNRRATDFYEQRSIDGFRALSDQLDRTSRTNNRGRSGCKLTPLGQSGGAIEFEVLAVVKMTFLVEMIVDRGVGGSKFLHGLDVLSAHHVRG